MMQFRNDTEKFGNTFILTVSEKTCEFEKNTQSTVNKAPKNKRKCLNLVI